MSGDDILAKVRRALHLADSIQAEDSDAVHRLLKAAERARRAQQEFLSLLEKARPKTVQGQQAKTMLLDHYAPLEREGDLLGRVVGTNDSAKSEIHTRIPPNQVQ